MEISGLDKQQSTRSRPTVLQICAMVATVRRWCTPFIVANQVGDTIATMRTIIFMYCSF